MTAGPKKRITVLKLKPKNLPESGPERIIGWIERYCIVPRGHGAGKRVKLRQFQKEIIRGAFSPGVKTALVSMPRANGKTMLGAMLGLWQIFDGPMSAEVLVVASDLRQSTITYNLARRMVELNPKLEQRAHIFRDHLYIPQNDANLVPMAAEPQGLHGYDPSLLIVDELHVVTDQIWEAATTAAGKRPESLTFAISTPAEHKDSLMWRLVEHGRKNEDPTFYFREYAAPEGCRIDDEKMWDIANPALSDPDPFLARDALPAMLATTREPAFRRLRLGQWVGQMSKWLPWDSWEPLEDNNIVVHPTTPIVAFFDGSASGDSTALVGCTVTKDDKPHIFVIGSWVNPGDERWRVPRREVSETVAEMFNRYNVIELACDPWGWRSEIEQWASKHGNRKVIEWPTHVLSRMAPATDRFYAAVREQRLTHDGNQLLLEHLNNCVAKSTPLGDVVVKEKRGKSAAGGREKKIDLAVCAIGAYDRAAYHANQKTKGRRVVSLR